MKKYTAAALAILLSATIASASQTPKTVTTAVKGTTHVVAAEIVKADATAKTLTIKDPKNATGADITMPVEGKAIKELATVTAGEKVNLTCRDNAKGEHQAISNIKAVKPVVVAKTVKK
jgi:hypothetical protein